MRDLYGINKPPDIREYLLYISTGIKRLKLRIRRNLLIPRGHGKNCFVTATKLGTTNNFFVAATKNFSAATKRFVDGTKHVVVVTKYFCCPYFNK